MKSSRQAMIARLIAAENIETQEELAQKLKENGYYVTQATVSRDIKEMRLVKTPASDGNYRYSTAEKAEADLKERFISIFESSVLSVSSAGNLIVIKTITGSASAAAEAVDSLNWPEICGSIAGDNTIFLAVHDLDAVPELIRRFQKLLK